MKLWKAKESLKAKLCTYQKSIFTVFFSFLGVKKCSIALPAILFMLSILCRKSSWAVMLFPETAMFSLEINTVPKMNSKFTFTNFYELFKPIPNQFLSVVYNYAWKIDNGFEIKMMVKSNGNKIVFKYWGPFMIYQLINTDQSSTLSGIGLDWLFWLAARS